MKDPQSTVHTPAGGIPFISATLHCFSIPLLVFLRRDFGYSYLGPKKIFFALVFACALLTYATANDESLHTPLLFPAVFGSAASILYFLHLTVASVKQGQGRAQHDQDSGTSHLIILFHPSKRQKVHGILHIVVEPLIVVVAASAFATGPFASILTVCGLSLALKETLRWWLMLRLRKRREDSRADAGELMGETEGGFQQLPTAEGKTGRERIRRNFPNGEQDVTLIDRVPSDD